MSKAQPLPPDFGHIGVENFFYCPDPLLMTDEEVEAEYPAERRREFWRSLARDQQHPDPTAFALPVRERTPDGS